MQPTLPHAGVQHEPTVPQTPRSVKEKFCQFIHTAEHVFRKSGIFIPEDWELWQFAVIAALCFSTAVVVLYLSTRLGRPTHFSPSAPRLGYQSGPSNRGTISIVSSCLLTIYSCTYAVFHSDPVLSSSQETEGKLHMWFIAIASLLIPEYLLTTSVDQLSKAWKFNTMMKKTGFRDWNMAMSFLAISNAFTEQPDGTDQLNETSIREHIEDKRRMNPSVAIDYDYIKFEIRSRSKQDSLGKLLATLQVLRLGVQTVTRWAAGLSVTPLELVTCGYVFLAAGTYIAWWSKPYSLRGTVWLKLSGVEVEARPREEHGIQEVNVIGRDDQGQLLPVTAEKGSELPDQSGAISIKRVLFLLFSYSAFCAIHIAAWNAEFITSFGQPLWRVCSICQAAFLVLFAFVLYDARKEKSARKLPSYFLTFSALTCISGYLLVRLTLSGLVIMSFWSLPADAYEEVNWLYFVPQWT